VKLAQRKGGHFMDELLKAIPSLLGVLIGGLLTFLIQQNSLKKQQEWERNKIIVDNYERETTSKLEIYNKILNLDSTKIIYETTHQTGETRLIVNNYNEFIRPLLFQSYHLLDEEVANEVDTIEEIFERQFVMEEEDPDDKNTLCKSYLNIISVIRKQFKVFRKSRKELIDKFNTD